MIRCYENTRFTVVILTIIAAILASCNLQAEEVTTPTLNVTQAYQTVEARLTEAIAQTPRATATEPSQATATAAPTTAVPTHTAATATASAATTQPPNALCDQALAGSPIDVTIPDDTQLAPGEEFTKTWRLQNAGTCTWTPEYALAWFSGEQLDAPTTVLLTGQVLPGQTVDLSVDMKAPATTGTYRSDWKLRNPSGATFGIGPSGGSTFWVQIVVAQSGTATVSPTPATITPTPTATQGVQVSGSATLQIDDVYDLDTNQVNSGGEDVSYQEAEQNHVLSPVDGAALTLFGGTEPTLAQCQSLDLFPTPLQIDALVGTYLCYRTNTALPGRLFLRGIDADTGALQVEIYTWTIP